MTVTTEDIEAGGGPVSRWSPRRWAHHRYLWWTGALVVGGVAVAIASGRDASPGPGITDGGALAVLVTVVLLSPFLLFGAVHSLSFAIRRRVHDDVRVYGVGQPVRAEVPLPERGTPGGPPAGGGGAAARGGAPGARRPPRGRARRAQRPPPVRRDRR